MAGQQPYKAVIEKDPAFFAGVATQDPEVVGALLKAFARSWAGTTPDEFDAQVHEWLQTAKQPKLGVAYVELVYQPMLELLEYLRPDRPAPRVRWWQCRRGHRDAGGGPVRPAPQP